jgi:hypothetical protein
MVQACLGSSGIRIGRRIIFVNWSPGVHPGLLVYSNGQTCFAGAYEETRMWYDHGGYSRSGGLHLLIATGIAADKIDVGTSNTSP